MKEGLPCTDQIHPFSGCHGRKNETIHEDDAKEEQGSDCCDLVANPKDIRHPSAADESCECLKEALPLSATKANTIRGVNRSAKDDCEERNTTLKAPLLEVEEKECPFSLEQDVNNTTLQNRQGQFIDSNREAPSLDSKPVNIRADSCPQDLGSAVKLEQNAVSLEHVSSSVNMSDTREDSNLCNSKRNISELILRIQEGEQEVDSGCTQQVDGHDRVCCQPLTAYAAHPQQGRLWEQGHEEIEQKGHRRDVSKARHAEGRKSVTYGGSLLSPNRRPSDIPTASGQSVSPHYIKKSPQSLRIPSPNSNQHGNDLANTKPPFRSILPLSQSPLQIIQANLHNQQEQQGKEIRQTDTLITNNTQCVRQNLSQRDTQGRGEFFSPQSRHLAVPPLGNQDKNRTFLDYRHQKVESNQPIYGHPQFKSLSKPANSEKTTHYQTNRTQQKLQPFSLDVTHHEPKPISFTNNTYLTSSGIRQRSDRDLHHVSSNPKALDCYAVESRDSLIEVKTRRTYPTVLQDQSKTIPPPRALETSEGSIGELNITQNFHERVNSFASHIPPSMNHSSGAAFAYQSVEQSRLSNALLGNSGTNLSDGKNNRLAHQNLNSNFLSPKSQDETTEEQTADRGFGYKPFQGDPMNMGPFTPSRKTSKPMQPTLTPNSHNLHAETSPLINSNLQHGLTRSSNTIGSGGSDGGAQIGATVHSALNVSSTSAFHRPTTERHRKSHQSDYYQQGTSPSYRQSLPTQHIPIETEKVRTPLRLQDRQSQGSHSSGSFYHHHHHNFTHGFEHDPQITHQDHQYRGSHPNHHSFCETCSPSQCNSNDSHATSISQSRRIHVSNLYHPHIYDGVNHHHGDCQLNVGEKRTSTDDELSHEFWISKFAMSGNSEKLISQKRDINKDSAGFNESVCFENPSRYSHLHQSQNPWQYVPNQHHDQSRRHQIASNEFHKDNSFDAEKSCLNMMPMNETANSSSLLQNQQLLNSANNSSYRGRKAKDDSPTKRKREPEQELEFENERFWKKNILKRSKSNEDGSVREQMTRETEELEGKVRDSANGDITNANQKCKKTFQKTSNIDVRKKKKQSAKTEKTLRITKKYQNSSTRKTERITRNVQHLPSITESEEDDYLEEEEEEKYEEDNAEEDNDFEYKEPSTSSSTSISTSKATRKKSKSGKKKGSKSLATTCHQCKQKNNDKKVECPKCSRGSIKGVFCKSCLQNRYGLQVGQVLKDSAWLCPICENICNCASCRTKLNRHPKSIDPKKVKEEGCQSVHHYLMVTEYSEEFRNRITRECYRIPSPPEKK